MFNFNKLHRGACLSLFVASSIATYFKPHLVSVAGLALVGLVCYDIVCFLKEKSKQTNFAPDIAKMQASQEDLIQKVADIRNDASIGKLAETFRRK